MKPWKRLFFYLILNALVSACATFTVLFLWDQFSGPIPRNLLPQAMQILSPAAALTAEPTPADTPVPQPTATESFTVYVVQSGDTFESIAAANNVSVAELLAVNGFTQSQPLGDGEVLRIPDNPKTSVDIESVIGAGDLEAERVLLRQRGEDEIDLTGWQLDDGQGHIFTFPQITLFRNGAVNIYTRPGANTVVELYWGLKQPLWASGATVTLRDAQGGVAAKYKVP